MKIKQLDHFVLTVSNIQTSVHFYTEILGMQHITFADNRSALTFGNQKINLHQYKNEFKPHAKKPTCGSADLCFIVETPIEKIQQELFEKNVAIEEGPIKRSGSSGEIISVYIRDPDENLIELSNVI